jgi:hypothetical protein
MVLLKLKSILGSKISLGKTYGIEKSRLHSFLQEKITLTKRISTRTGKIRMMNNSSKMH